MEKAKPLKLISKRISHPAQLGGFRTLPVKSRRPVNKHWLWSTTNANGSIKDAYKPTLEALAGLYDYTRELQDVRQALIAKHFDVAESQLAALLPQSRLRRPVGSWRELSLMSPSGSYGPPVLKNILEAIRDLHKDDPVVVRRLLRPRDRRTDIYIIPAAVGLLAKHNHDIAIEVLAHSDLDLEARQLGLTALLYSIEMKPTVVVKALQSVPLPDQFKLPTDLERRLLAYTSDMSCIDALQAMISARLDISSPVMDKILRRVFSYSDRGAEAILDNAVSAHYPLTLLPFIIRQLCKRVAAGSDHARLLLDTTFDEVLPRLAEVQPSIVLHLLVMRIITTDGIQATAPVLDRWVATDPKGVNEPTWLLLFQAFRRLGRPDKCMDVLTRALTSSPRLSLPFIGEYLSYVAQFYNLHVYLRSLRQVIPGISPTLVMLGIKHHEKQLPPAAESYLQPLRITLKPENRNFKVERIHESWLSITYQAVLATVDDEAQALRLYKKYSNYVRYSGVPISLRVVDQFVKLLASIPHGIDSAEWVYRDALSRLPLKRPVDGSNNSVSLETLCYRLVRQNELERAAKLLNDALSNERVVVRGSTLSPVIDAAPRELRNRLIEWAERIGARMQPEVETDLRQIQSN